MWREKEGYDNVNSKDVDVNDTNVVALAGETIEWVCIFVGMLVPSCLVAPVGPVLAIFEKNCPVHIFSGRFV